MGAIGVELLGVKPWRVLWIAVAIAGVVVACALILGRSGGPVHEGRSVAEWIELYREGSLAEREDAEDAFRSLGDAAVPYLLGVLTRPDRSAAIEAYANLRQRLPRPIARLLPHPSENTQRDAASRLLTVSQPSSKVLLPRLRPWLSPEDPRYFQALLLLGSMGDGGGVPFLVQALQSTNQLQ